MTFVDDDLGFMLSDFDTRTIVAGSVTVQGHLEETDAITSDGLGMGGEVMNRLTLLRVRRADFEDNLGNLVLTRGDTVTVDGVAYTLSDFLVGDPNALVVTGRDGRELVMRIRKV